MNYYYSIAGKDARGNDWETSGIVSVEQNDPREACALALSASFEQLTKGRASYGNPGVGCTGPYSINEIRLSRVQKQERLS